MKTVVKMRFIPLLLIMSLIIIMATPTVGRAAQATVNLGITSTFAVLAGTTITNTGPTTINGDAGGDIGLSPGAAFTGQASVTTSGTIHVADATAVAAKVALITAYDDAAGRTPVTRIPTELGGTTLTPGTYDSADGTFQITGTLTLNAQGDPDGVFVFKTATTLITATGSNINLINNARYCRTFWQVGSSATLGINSHFVGHIFALTSITANNGATVQGQLLARNGAITLNTNTITNGICATTATLHVIKHVINDDGRTAVASNFNLHVRSLGVDVVGSPALGAESPGTTYTLAAGTYVVSEDAFSDYTTSYSGDSLNGSIVLAAGDNKTITITNNDISIPPIIVAPTIAPTATPTVAPTATPTIAPTVAPTAAPTAPAAPPLINIVKTPEPLALTTGQGMVTYTYKVTNPGIVELSNVSVTDDKVSPVNYIYGDINNDTLLQTNETWIYTSKTNLAVTTTNTATAKGIANGMIATDIAFATVVVTPPAVTITTVTGGQIPNTATPWYNVLFAGVIFMIIGVLGLRNRKIYV